MQFKLVAEATIAARRKSADRAHATRAAFWIERFGKHDAEKITPEMIAPAMVELSRRRATYVKRTKAGPMKVESNKTLSPATCNRFLATLGTIYADARREGLVRLGFVSPTKGVPRRTPGPGRRVTVTTRDAQALIACARVSRNPSLAALVAVASTSGLRLGSLNAIRWRDVHLDRGHIDVATTKNGEPHRAVLLPFVIEELKRWKKLASEARPDDRVFPVKNPNKALQNALRMAELPTTWTFHSLRHVAASVLAQSGASVPQIMATLNHKSPAMALRYSHLNTASQRAALSTAWEK
jgi:integrase